MIPKKMMMMSQVEMSKMFVSFHFGRDVLYLDHRVPILPNAALQEYIIHLISSYSKFLR